MEPETSNYIQDLENKNAQKDNKINELTGTVGNTIFSQAQDTNLIVWQLELDNILERIEHLLKGDVIVDDGNGNLVYTIPEDESLIILNNYGVQLIMNVISFYLNRNTILSNYGWERIREILHDLGHEIADVIYINYEKMGLISTEKKSRAELLVLNILHTIESAYNRSLGGGERESLRSARIVHQNINPVGSAGGSYMKKKGIGGFLNPKNWDL